MDYRSERKCNIFICMMIINVCVTCRFHTNVKQPMRGKLL